MSRRSSRRLLVPGAQQGLDAFKVAVMQREGYSVNPLRPDDVKYEVAKRMGIPLNNTGDNGHLSTKSAGQVGGRIGGTMVREMIKIAKEQLAGQSR
ncbi:alpha/beta-type small acid-soluble spore protein [Paenibacillus psychroresistens]|uniref:Alpha/beta-type small acid-soluble spore protein n=1 Tax=Paenibacillus psychroresistens TaxID=1778678 RepID=A0A6B8RUV2_9BACL|nr:alpha/beta-type small acid-soluble spore protein [Paenibacillus psychroresistens]QGQ99717.1 alpha/beta-type small acid-soluble spore protein [Paenibacillus psychroresistens]